LNYFFLKKLGYSSNNRDCFSFLPAEAEAIHLEIENIIENVTQKLEAGKREPEERDELYPSD